MDELNLRRVLNAERIRISNPAERVDSESNEVWRIGDLYVRICWRGDRARLFREAQVATLLPPEIGYPEILGVGEDDDISWMVTRAVAAVPVSKVIHNLDSNTRERAGRCLGKLLHIVHGIPVPRGINNRPGVDIVGEDRYPLPIPRAYKVLETIRRMPEVETSVIDLIETQLEELEPLDPFAQPGVLLHGDAGIENLLWHEGQVVGLIDFEWVRSGDAWVDVIGYLTNGDPAVAKGVRDAYPEPFNCISANRCLRLLEIANLIRTIIAWPGMRNAERLRVLANTPLPEGST